MKTKKVRINRIKATLVMFKGIWVYPLITWYEGGLGSPVAVLLYTWKRHPLFFWRRTEIEYLADVTVNIPSANRSAGCSFIDTKNNGEDIILWLENYGFGYRTGNIAHSGFWDYPEFNFYVGANFPEYRNCKLNEILR